MQAYTQAMQAYGSSPSQPTGRAGAVWNDSFYDPGSSTTSSLNGSAGASRGPGPVAPNINDFYTGGDQWTQSMQFSRRSRSCMRMSCNRWARLLISAACPRLARLTIPIWRRTMQLSCLWNGSIQSWIANTRVCGRRWPTKESRKGQCLFSGVVSRFGEQRNDASEPGGFGGYWPGDAAARIDVQSDEPAAQSSDARAVLCPRLAAQRVQRVARWLFFHAVSGVCAASYHRSS